jgi:23S rRNA-/tRNA-specific pseudouridylate synthase
VTRLLVPPESAGERLDRFLAQLPEIGSRAVAERLLGGGAVLVDGQSRAKSYKLEGGEQVEFDPPAPPASRLEPEAMDLVVPYEDEHLLVVDKPPGIVVHPAPGHTSGTLVHGLLALDAEAGSTGPPTAARGVATSPSVRASCTGSTATRRASSSSHGRPWRTAVCRISSARAG